ncbi:Fic family protein [Pseudomonas sp.]|uniref:Fic family protein n=1 Tax=Pseudomonas sp. TaxID=306 RepID=UPI001303367A|nr:Fic family protein [Pseudomonas sp.]
MSDIGYTWIAHHTGVSPVQPFAVVSQINGRRATTQDGDLRTEVYPERYRPQNLLIDHLVFALRYEGIHLEFLARLFAKVSVREQLEHWINAEPSGTYARRLGFLCEWLTGQPLTITQAIQGNYIDVLDPALYVTGAAVKSPRWKVRDNLPGTPDYCPLIRRVDRIIATERYDIRERLDSLQADFGLDLLLRSTVWLTVKESRASFLIEHEQDQEDRIRRFATVMESECGQHPDPLAPDVLESLQASILGQSALRYGLRQSPVYVGHVARFAPVVDYIAPHWTHTPALLQGLGDFLRRTTSVHPIIRAAVASFGFVYVHPMADGNGRLSRFLINDVLRRDGAIPAPIILPISATITNSTYNKAAYDQALERFSRPLMHYYATCYRFGESRVAEDGVEYNLHFDAYDDALPAWKYPDLTAHAVYLAQVIDSTLTHEMRAEAQFLQSNEQARTRIKAFLEAPDNELDRIIHAVRENGNVLSGKLRRKYPLLDQRPELAERLVAAVRTAFQAID